MKYQATLTLWWNCVRTQSRLVRLVLHAWVTHGLIVSNIPPSLSYPIHESPYPCMCTLMSYLHISLGEKTPAINARLEVLSRHVGQSSWLVSCARDLAELQAYLWSSCRPKNPCYSSSYSQQSPVRDKPFHFDKSVPRNIYYWNTPKESSRRNDYLFFSSDWLFGPPKNQCFLILHSQGEKIQDFKEAYIFEKIISSGL